MSYDIRAEIFALRTETAPDGSPSQTWRQVGTVYLEEVRLSASSVLAASKDGTLTDTAYNYRPHSLIGSGAQLRLRFRGADNDVVRIDPRGRSRAGTLYTRRTDV